MPRDNSTSPAVHEQPASQQPSSRQPVASTPSIGLASAWAFTALWLTISAVLLFWNLDWYPFWGDEADTVVFARSVWETGDVGAKYGEHNYYLYRNGTLLDNLKNRSTPPLAYYLVAPIWGMFGPDHFWMRAPFALFGLATVGLLCRWLWRSGASASMWLCVGAAVALNPQLLLYARQCRYYSLASLLTLAVAYLYWFYQGRRSQVVGVSVLLCMLAATHYLHFAALAGVLIVDYALWRHRERRLTIRDWLRLVIPIVIVVVPLVWVYNPLGKNSLGDDMTKSFVNDKLKLLWFSLRDMNNCEFGVGIILLLAPVVAWRRRDTTLLRLFVACVVYLLATTLCSPQPMKSADVADVRYLAPLLIACLYLTIRTLDTALGSRAWLVVPAVALALGTNVLNRPDDSGMWRSTIYEFVYELRHPRRVAGRMVADWLNANVEPGKMVWIEPSEYSAPQLIEAPHIFYSWEIYDLRDPNKFIEIEEFTRHLRGRIPVDYIVAYGLNDTLKNVKEKVLPEMATKENGNQIYEPAATFDVFYDDRTRPELHWHWFRDGTYDKTTRSIVIYRLKR